MKYMYLQVQVRVTSFDSSNALMCIIKLQDKTKFLNFTRPSAVLTDPVTQEGLALGYSEFILLA